MSHEKACDGGRVLEEGDFAECIECGSRVRWDLRDDAFWGFQNCRDKSPALTDDGHDHQRSDAVDPAAPRRQEGPTREGQTLSVTEALRSLPPVPMQQVIEEMQAAADPSVTLQKVTFNQLVTWIAALRSLASPEQENDAERWLVGLMRACWCRGCAQATPHRPLLAPMPLVQCLACGDTHTPTVTNE
jgi:hypothetical protein